MEKVSASLQDLVTRLCAKVRLTGIPRAIVEAVADETCQALNITPETKPCLSCGVRFTPNEHLWISGGLECQGPDLHKVPGKQLCPSCVDDMTTRLSKRSVLDFPLEALRAFDEVPPAPGAAKTLWEIDQKLKDQGGLPALLKKQDEERKKAQEAFRAKMQAEDEAFHAMCKSKGVDLDNLDYPDGASEQAH